MKIIRIGPVVYEFSWPAISALFSLLPLLVALGFWQLGRAQEKEELLLMQQQRMSDNPLRLAAGDAVDPEALRFRTVIVTGQYQSDRQFLLDNQVHNGRPGYFVLTPFSIDHQEQQLLVNRGWVPADADRSVMPAIGMPPDTGTITLSGHINHFPAVGIKLAGAEIPTEGWPARVHVVDIQVLSKRLGKPLYDFQLQLDAAQAYGFVREWKTAVALSPEKHRAYAWQWFGLALTLTILFVWYSFKIERHG